MSREVNPNNEMGHQEQSMKSKVLAIALQKPENYYRLRDCIMAVVRDSITKNVFDLFKGVLSEGKVPSVGDTADLKELGFEAGQIKYEAIGGKWIPFVPNLPFADVQAFALDCAEIMESKCDEAIEYILPLDFKELANKKSNTLLKASRGI